ncbi:MAG: NADH-quinone oxidoreductase subunit J [Acidimicrobiia bacterium]
MIELVLFVVVGSAAIGGALAVIFAKNPVYAALGLLGTLFSLGVFYVVNLAHLVAVVQVIVYAGAVLTLFLFVIMMIGVDKDQAGDEPLRYQRALVGGLGLIILLVGGGLAVGGRFDWVPTASGAETLPNGTVEALAGRLFTDWVLAFEVTALLLTIAAAGAIALAYFKHDGSEPVE